MTIALDLMSARVKLMNNFQESSASVSQGGEMACYVLLYFGLGQSVGSAAV